MAAAQVGKVQGELSAKIAFARGLGSLGRAMIKCWLEIFLRPHRAEFILRAAAMLFFLWLAGRFWHPHFGFTRFLQLDAQSAAATLPELRDAPLYTVTTGITTRNWRLGGVDRASVFGRGAAQRAAGAH